MINFCRFLRKLPLPLDRAVAHNTKRNAQLRQVVRRHNNPPLVRDRRVESVNSEACVRH